jgi:predicted phosphodiesterase
MHQREIIVGVISDTHGLMRPAAIEALRGCDLIIHAGDVGTPEVIDALRGAEAIGMAATPALSLREFRRVTPSHPL